MTLRKDLGGDPVKIKQDQNKKIYKLMKRAYEIPFYNINGEKDYMVNAELAQEYFDTVEAPRKKLFLMEDTRHGLLLTKTEMFSEILHEIAAAERR